MLTKFIRCFAIVLFTLSTVVFQAGCGSEDDSASKEPDPNYGNPSDSLETPPPDPVTGR
jgi:hypothetical protein